jgi:hypothetical protein
VEDELVLEIVGNVHVEGLWGGAGGWLPGLVRWGVPLHWGCLGDSGSYLGHVTLV